MGNNILMLGDCLERMKEIPDGSVDMVLADPPYGTTACKWDSVIPLAAMWEQLKRVTKNDGAIVMTASHPFASQLGASNITDLRYSLVWVKENATGHLNAKRMPMKLHEDILIWYKRQPTYWPQGAVACNKIARKGGNGSCYRKSKNEFLQTMEGYPRSLLKFKRDSSKVHPTQKPVALMEYLIRTYTNEGETVLDFTMGSGSTGVACVNTNRKFIGIELDTAYFETARRRIEGAKAKVPA